MCETTPRAASCSTGLNERAVALGWPADGVRAIDSDLAISTASAAVADGQGFGKLADDLVSAP
jgi:hypothetical protein